LLFLSGEEEVVTFFTGKWYQFIPSLKKNEALESKNYLALYNAITNEVKVSYEFDVYTRYVSIEKDLPGYPKPEMPDKIPVFNRMLEKIQKASEYYSQIGHIENLIVALSVKYEILHFLENLDKAEEVLNEMEMIINTYDLDNQKIRFVNLKNKGTTHEHFSHLVSEILDKAKIDKDEYDIIVREMKKMDDIKKKINKITNEIFVIQLFPIGYFQFPKSDKDKVFHILNIQSDKAKRNFKELFESGIIPVANIFYEIIKQEGYLNGKLADVGIQSWRHIYKIRKGFHENNYHRFEMIH
jgi:hypothetical protein